MRNSLNIRAACLLAAVVGAWSTLAHALPEVTNEKGITGDFGIGGGYLNLKSNTVAGTGIIDIDDDEISPGDLTSSAGGRTAFQPIALNEVRMNFGWNRTEFYVGDSVENAVTLDRATELGLRKTFDDLGTMQAGFLLNRIIPVEVYQDPFITDTERRKTDAVKYGARFQWDRIFGSAFEWQVTGRTIDVDKDSNGQSLLIGDPANPDELPDGVNLITADQLGLLERDANELYTRLSYLFEPGEGHKVRPLVGYTTRNADGDAESFDGLRAQLTYAYQNEDVLFVTNVLYGQRDFDERNPIYNEFRDSESLVLDATVRVPMPNFDDGNWSWFINAIWGQEDADIDFYDQEAFRIAVGINYKLTPEYWERKK